MLHRYNSLQRLPQSGKVEHLGHLPLRLRKVNFLYVYLFVCRLLPRKCVWPALGLTTTYQSSVSLHTTYKRYFVTTCFCLSNSIFFFFFFLFLQNRTRLSMMKEQCPWFRGMKSLTGGFGGRMNNTSGRHERSYSGEILLKITITSSQERGNPDAVWPEHWALQCI